MEYTVKAGDSLSIIARDIMGDLTQWPAIAQANGLSDPYVIYPGQVLQVPDPGTIQYGPASLAPTTGMPMATPAWLSNPWVWLAVGAGALWWWSGKKKKR